MNITSIPGRRPAETTAAASAIALLICKAFGLDDPDVLVALAVVIGFIPTLVTTVVEWRRSRSS